MKHEDHVNETLLKLGKPFSEVHYWLDIFYKDESLLTRHRQKRHHLAGIEEARILFGNEGAEAAKIHIESDLKQEGWDENKHPFPKNEKDYIRMGFW